MSEASPQVPEGATVDNQDKPAAGDKPDERVEVVTQGMGGRTTTGEPEPKPVNSVKSTETDERYAKDQAALSARVLAVREAIGSRRVMSDITSMTQSAIWRGENGKIHPAEVARWTEVLNDLEARVAAGEWAKASDPGQGKLLMTLEAIGEALKFLDQLDRLVKAKDAKAFLGQAVSILTEATK